jgi:hypothetical protein
VKSTEPPDDLLATITDAKGRTVSLRQERWEHIVQGHPDVRLPDLKHAVEVADKRTNAGGSCEKLWARNVGPTNWLCVVVAYKRQVGLVRTAICTKKGPREQELI